MNEAYNENTEGNLKLNVKNVKELWTKTYNTKGKPDWRHIFPYYHPEIVFKDPIQRIEGINEFKAMCNRLTKRCKQLKMKIHFITRKDNIIFMQWTMTMVFRRSPNTPIYGCTKLILNKDERIIEQRDYYDLWGDIFDRIPCFRVIYKKLIKKLFG
jgi:limonene-1,2-epoxide hydrolase